MHPQDRFSWAWLGVGMLLLPFSAFETVLPIAAWLAPVFLLRFVRTQRVVVGLPAVALAYGVGAIIGFRDILPPPTNYLVGLLSMIVVIPYALWPCQSLPSCSTVITTFPLACPASR
jgi:apolipoprotein N-acyltransferase